jgi:hypothetical protein
MDVSTGPSRSTASALSRSLYGNPSHVGRSRSSREKEQMEILNYLKLFHKQVYEHRH